VSNKTINEFEKLLPKHKASLTITHNDHKDYYDSIDDWAKKNDKAELFGCNYEWVSEEEKQRAIELDSLWTMQAYPHTPIGFYSYCASSLEALINYVNEEH